MTDTAVSMSLYHGKVLLSFAAILPCLSLCFLQGSDLVRPFSQGRRCASHHEGLDLGMLRKQPVIIAVIRGGSVDRAVELALAAYDAGFKMFSVTVDSPEYPRALHTMAEAINVKAAQDRVMLGVSSATTTHQVETASQAGAQFISTKKLYSPVLVRTKELGLVSITGVSTPSEAAEAIELGADILKAFPVINLSIHDLRKIVQVSAHSSIPVIAAGGVEVEHLEGYSKMGVSGFALGKTMFKPEYSIEEMKRKARRLIIEANRSVVGLPQSPSRETICVLDGTHRYLSYLPRLMYPTRAQLDGDE